MSPEELRLRTARGEIAFRSSEYVDWVRLGDVLELSARVDAERQAALRSLSESWESE